MFAQVECGRERGGGGKEKSSPLMLLSLISTAGMYPNGICPHLITDSVCRHKAQNKLTVCESLGKCEATMKKSESIENYMSNFPHANTALLSKDVSIVTFYAFHTCSPPALQVVGR